MIDHSRKKGADRPKHTGVDRIEDQDVYDAVRPLDASAALVQREYESSSKERVGEGS